MGETNGDNKKKTAREIIENYNGPKVRIMEVCGTHTHEIFRLGIRKLLPEQVELISGPGCPVCVTPVSFIDEAIYLALEKGVTICTFGDLVRVPGTKMSLAGAREQGGKIHIVYSPADAEKYAKEHPKEQVTFLSVGFETTTPAGCLSVKSAKEDGLDNYSLLVANKTMPQAYEALKVVGRVKEQINRAGEKIMPSELEELIIKHPDIMDCAVIGIEDEMLGNKICVYAVARKNISLLDIRKHLEEAGIAMFKLPDVLRLVKRIPVTAMKKVDKEALRILEKEHYE